MEVTVEYLGAVQFEARARRHVIVSDQPEENGGFDEGMTPPEMLLASLGTCAGYYAAEYIRTRRLPSDGMRIQVTAEKAKAPARLASFRISVNIAAPLDDRSRDGIVRAIHSCLIHNTLQNPPEIALDIITPGHEESAAA